MANNTKSQNRSGSNQNKQGYNKKSAAAPTQEAQNTPVVKNEEKQVYKAKQTLTPDMYITVKNGFNGTLVYKSKKTGERFIWEAFGDEQDIELAELKAAKNSYKAFFVNNWFLFDDPEVVEWLGMSQYYKHALNSESFDKLFEKTPEEIILEFAESNGIEINNMDQTLEMIKGFWIPNYSESITEFGKNKNENVFKKAIGFDPEYASAYFNLVDVDIKKIQEKLLDLKRYRAKAKEMQSNGLLIGLYCYLLEGNIPCGPKNRAPERTKALRPENLKAFIAA